MATGFFFKSLEFRNYRGLRKLNLKDLKRINIIGGKNGAGKSTILDGIFLTLGRNNPFALLRPFQIKQSNVAFPDGLNYLFSDQDITSEVNICADLANSRKLKLVLRMEPVKELHVSAFNGISNRISSTISTQSSDTGVKCEMSITDFSGTKTDKIFYWQQSAEQLNLHIEKNNGAITPHAVIVSAGLSGNPKEDAERYSVLAKLNKIGKLIEVLQQIDPELKGLSLFQENGNPVLYAEFKNGDIRQTFLLGSGFQLILSVSMMLMTMKDGIFLFDEIESSIHYKFLEEFWKQITKLANENNAQIFAVTHSSECIAAAIRGITSTGNMQDLNYIRLENRGSETAAIQYTGEELSDAFEFNSEVR
ncbi:AAA family ATPase [Undibacterium sp. WLX3042]|uniref:AAA family ATPase n=1 Tax=Undibacterium sp. WLX3042 TaxID=3412686 RepID=UPI003C2BEE24